MTLADFRRIPGDAAEAAAAVEQDIAQLAEQDPGLRIRGITAWRHSALMAEYQRLVGHALVSGDAVDRVLADAVRNVSGMTREEFTAMRTLSAALRG